MRPVIKATIATAAVALVGAAGCSAGGSAKTDDQPPENALSKIEPCSILKPDKATQAGLPAQGTPSTAIPSQPGCTYIGDYAGIGVYTIPGSTLDELGNRPVWDEFKRMKINGRDGAEGHSTGTTDKQCVTAISTGGGVLTIQVNPSDPRKPFDACAESLKVAKLIEPDLPK